nr:hypothetical protein [Nocardioides dokdonensis]
MAGISPSVTASSTWFSVEVMQAAASRAKSGCLLNAPTPMSMPPTGGAESSPSTVRG